MSDPADDLRTLRLSRCGARDHGSTLGLRAGDLLAGVNGARWQGSPAALSARLAAAPEPLVLTFLRDGALLSVLTDRADLGPWDEVPAPGPDMPAGPATVGLCNWEIMRRPDGTHDLFARRPSLMALVAPALWLARMRLWTWFFTLVTGLVLALPGGAPLMFAVWMAAGLHLWRSGDGHLRTARLSEGFYTAGIIAARSEAEACRSWAALDPGAQFRFDRRASAVADPALQNG
ncbi:hypothetical protein [Paracoccus sp. T5]|uniref:hypothetical protein n=1 Tax=Paracoccus sp. T5 TaxID=3402161 RepID=UPI003AE46416